MVCCIKSRSFSSIQNTVPCFDKMVMSCHVRNIVKKYLPVMNVTKYSRTPLIRINLDGEPSAYAENLDN